MLTRALFRTVACLALVASAAPAYAQSGGVRAGASVNPDQFYFGGHLETDALVDRLHLRPNVEVGVGDDVTTVAVNLEVVYKVPLRKTPWTFYGGGGPAINYYNRDERGSNTEGGMTLLAGLEHAEGLFLEVKVGAWDSPDLKFGIGYVFGR